MPDKQRVLVIGLDGGTFTVLQPLIDRGGLPHLAGMQNTGSWGSLLSTVPPVTAPAWASFMTGAGPAQHGIYNFFKRDSSGYAYEDTMGFVHAGLVRSPTLWGILSQAGKRVGVVNVPLTYPPCPVNGFMITGMLTPPSASSFTYPTDLGQRLDGYQIDLDYTRTETGFSLDEHPEEDDLLFGVTEMLDRRAEHCLRLMEEEDWDCFAVVFVGTDRLFHELWHYLDPCCPAYSSVRGEVVRRSVEAYLSRLDTVVGQLRAVAGAGATTIVMSDHGFGPAPEKRVNLNDWLVQLGLLHVACSGRDVLRPEFWATRLGLRRPAVKQALERCVPLHLLRRAGTDRRGRREIPADWTHTRAYAVQMYNHVCGIEINLKGRKRLGIVDPGTDYEQLRDWIISELSDLHDPETGVQLVERAHRREDLFKGPYLDQAPDIVIELDPHYAGMAPLGNRGIVAPHNSRRQGDHRREGIFLVQGPDVVPGVLSPSPAITDLAPTILYLLGVAIPSEVNGCVLTHIFRPEHLASHPIQRDDIVLRSPLAGGGAYSTQEAAEISERLHNLGYLE